MGKMLVICGPTAVGKTNLALHLAKKFDGEIISADSRQVYECMDIGTGKDIPLGFGKKTSSILWQGKRLNYYKEKTKIWGYDLVSPKEQFSVASFVTFAQKIIEDILARNRLPIVVGGTGFYIRALTQGYETLHIQKNPELRQSLQKKSAAGLFSYLVKINPVKAKSMNDSDKNNPRRLIRAIEISMAKKNLKEKTKIADDILMIGLMAPRDYLVKKIEERVEKRIKDGVLDEIKKLLSHGVGWQNQSMQALGYRQWAAYFKKEPRNKELFEQCKKAWIKEEKKYAKRQMTWFNKNENIHWFDITKDDFRQDIEEKIKKWYSKMN